MSNKCPWVKSPSPCADATDDEIEAEARRRWDLLGDDELRRNYDLPTQALEESATVASILLV